MAMRISLNWLSDYISIPFTPDDLAHRLTMLGIEVEAIERPGERMKNVVVGEVLEVSPHPNADKLRLARVTIGNGEPLRIVCGAPNVRTGLKVAVATVGADLGEGFVIRKSKIRGEVSEGMLCSERELGISEHHEGIWELPGQFAIGAPLAEAMGLDDIIFEIGITPNRADCLSHIGIAREIRAISSEKLKLPTVAIEQNGGAIAKQVSIALPQPDLCPRYVAKLVRNVTVQPSPDWLKRKLEAVGLRAINNVVDVTNFVLMEYGHPLHAFDFDVVSKGQIVVRTAAGFAEEYTTLDHKSRTLPPDALLITDGVKPLGIAGIMGGENSAIRDTTKNVLIESAYFSPSSIRRTAKQLGLSTDASYRFERGTDFDIVRTAAERAARMIVELGGGEIVPGLIDEYPSEITHKRLTFRPERARALIGLDIPDERMREIFARLDLTFERESEGAWTLRAPSYRVDLEREEDAIEEIARIVGYDEIPTSTFERAPLTGLRDPLKLRDFDNLIRNTLLALGANECVSTPLVSAKDASRFHEKPVELINPLNIEKDRMRTSIALGLLDAVQHNERFGSAGQRLFEIGHVFHYSDSPEMLGHVREETEIGIAISGIQEPKSPYNAQPVKADIFLLKGLANALMERLSLAKPEYAPINRKLQRWASSDKYFDPEFSLLITISGREVGVMGRVANAIAKAYDLRSDAYLLLLDHAALFEMAHAKRLDPPKVRALPKYPSVERDIALVLKQDIIAKMVGDRIQAEMSELLQHVHIFDAFQSAEMKQSGERSLAFHLVFRSDERTLEEKEVDHIVEKIIQTLERELHARLRA
ncbi:MAG TPA: phenylalanine--tRNA ligase subunit beta [Candidatus Kapabacteria bacterium]|jgi:phenylalanyl-tRNA synthetase beta chain|nr:phenylalanine--tRNA ligase subunit beta [Candidatus Kapabacteria bacterium]